MKYMIFLCTKVSINYYSFLQEVVNYLNYLNQMYFFCNILMMSYYLFKIMFTLELKIED